MPLPENALRACSTRVLSTMNSSPGSSLNVTSSDGSSIDFRKAAIGGVIGLHVFIGDVDEGRRRAVVEADGDQLAIGPSSIIGRFDASLTPLLPAYSNRAQCRARRSKPCGFSARSRSATLKPSTTIEFAAIDRVFETGEKLQRRHRIAIGIVGMRLKPEIRIGEIVGIDLGAHLEPAAVIRLAHIAEQFGDIAQAHRLSRGTPVITAKP